MEVKAIRGATTLIEDSPEQVKERVEELLGEITSLNGISESDIVCIMFSSTNDIHSFYPARAAREAGFTTCALFSSLEPDFENSLPLCIRVMVIINGDRKPKFVYLHGAKILRKDLTNIVNVALDGPAGSGKSTVAKLIADRLGVLCLDTGAMYRAVALKCVRENADYADKDVVKHIVDNLDLKVEYKDGNQVTLLDGEDVSAYIRTPQVSLLSSYVSAYGFVRAKMVALQRAIAAERSCVIEGRDIGTNVLPDCEFKFFLTASPEVRAKRRCDQNAERGIIQSYEDILKDINERDFQDRNRAIAPLKQASDAFVIDTSDMTIEEVVSAIVLKVRERA